VFEVTATDADHSLRVTIGGSGSGSLDITVNAKKIFELVRELKGEEVELSLEGTVLVMKTEKSFYKIAGADTTDFPGAPEIEDGVELNLSASAFRDLILKSSFAVAKDEPRASLCGIQWELAADKTGMVATDGHRLGYTFIDTDLPVKDSFSRILSKKSVDTLVRITDPKSNDESIRVMVGEKYVSFETPSFIMISKLVDGQYPDYNKVIPKNNPKVVTLDKVEFYEALKGVLVMSSQKDHLVKMVFNNGTLEVTVTNREIGGEAKESISVEYDGDEHIIGFNGQYFTEILDIIQTQKVRLEMNMPINACLVYPVYDDEKDKTSEDLFLIMPLRIMDQI
jgi:DNA polymerase-3 subunit beta